VDDLLPIGEFARRSGLSPKRLRSYAAGGVLVPAAVDPASGYRYYATSQLHRAQLIDALRQAGMPLADVADFLGQPSARRLARWARHLDEQALERHEALERVGRLLDLDRAAATGEAGVRRGDRPEEEGPMFELRVATRSETGLVRENNEDSVAASALLMATADGMGGPPGGETASLLAVSLVEAAFNGASVHELVASARAANRAIWERASGSPGLEGMGTTLCAVGLIREGQLGLVNVGDSRAYLFRDGTLCQLSEDHTVVADLARRGELGPEEALSHPHRHVLTRALGVAPTVEVDWSVHDVASRDRLLLCTDGIFHELSFDDIDELMASGADVGSLADALVDEALGRGGRDNLSVVVGEVASIG